MNLECLVCDSTNVATSQFWKGINIWLKNPHTVNRRILVATHILSADLLCDPNEFLLSIKNDENLFEILQKDGNEKNLIRYLTSLNLIDENSISYSAITISDGSKNCIFIKKLLPRNCTLFSPTIEIIIVNKNGKTVTNFYKQIFKDKQSVGLNVISSINHNDHTGNVSICIDQSDQNCNEGSKHWLEKTLLPRLLNWMKNEYLENKITSGSLTFISSERYVQLYNELKNKYGKKLVEIWPECTDPAKFVYEDIAIATYLLILWAKERAEKGLTTLQSFLDLGCGNGLLVYILTKEGHEGTGIDLRKRKIWDLFPDDVKLQVCTITPSSSSLFPNVDWLIGNHSDELTPWIPVISARSSNNCRFFLLPCCAYEFNGRKYRRSDTSKSQYQEYLLYVKDICYKCGFDTYIDKLRIPSTKRTCFIGWNQDYRQDDEKIQNDIITNLINARSNEQEVKSDENNENKTDKWNVNFIPRQATEKVRNCTQINKAVIEETIDIVSSQLLQKVRMISVQDRTWNAGGQIELSEIVKLLRPDMLNQLKNECGGIQTLLRNNGHIFYVARGKVQFRIQGKSPLIKKTAKNIKALKTKECWFYRNHPDGCPMKEAECHFKH